MAALPIAGCSSPSGDAPPPPPPAPLSGPTLRPQPKAAAPAKSAGAKVPQALVKKQVGFLKRELQKSTQFRNVREVRVDAQGQLALILRRKLSQKERRSLLEAVLTNLMQEFPGENLIVVAYSSSQPATRVGIARLDANTLQISHASS